MARAMRRCATEGCGARAVRGSPFCRLHMQAVSTAVGPPGTQGESDDAARAAEGFYADVLSAEEWEDIRRQLGSERPSTEMAEGPPEARTTGGPSAAGTSGEVAVMRVLIRRVMQRIGEDDPLRALPLVRQGVDGICRALRTQRVLSGEGADSLSAAFAVALREIGEELGIGDQ